MLGPTNAIETETIIVKFHRRWASDTIVVKFVGSYSCDKCRECPSAVTIVYLTQNPLSSTDVVQNYKTNKN